MQNQFRAIPLATEIGSQSLLDMHRQALAHWLYEIELELQRNDELLCKLEKRGFISARYVTRFRDRQQGSRKALTNISKLRHALLLQQPFDFEGGN